MSEDVSSQVRLGATIILVAALIAAVLSLMVVAQTILTSGLSSLQAGVDQITVQEYEKYNQKKVSGTDVKAAFSLYSGKDVAIIVRTKACMDDDNKIYSDAAKTKRIWGFMYGTLLSKDSKTAPDRTASGTYTITYTDNTTSTDPGFTGLKSEVSSGVLWKPVGTANYVSYLWVLNDAIQVSYEISGMTTVGSDEYILDSARYRASLVKATGGNIIGIVFEQIN